MAWETYLATGLLVVNNLRDIDEDREADKRTLAVRFGPLFSRIQYSICIGLSALVPILFAMVRRNDDARATLIASLVIVPGLLVAQKVWRSDGLALRPCLGMTAGLLLLFTVLFCLGLSWV